MKGENEIRRLEDEQKFELEKMKMENQKENHAAKNEQAIMNIKNEQERKMKELNLEEKK